MCAAFDLSHSQLARAVEVCKAANFTLEKVSWAGEMMAQLVKGLLHKQGDPSSSPSTHIKGWV